MELKFQTLTRLHRARLVGQYHLYNEFGDLRIWAAWLNGLDARERAFVRFYWWINQPGALDYMDARCVAMSGNPRTLLLEVDP